MKEELTSDHEARADLALEYGMLFANYRALMLDRAKLESALNKTQEVLLTLQEKFAQISIEKDILANELRGKKLPLRKRNGQNANDREASK